MNDNTTRTPAMVADVVARGFPSGYPMPGWAVAGRYQTPADGLYGRGWWCPHGIPVKYRGLLADSFDTTASPLAAVAYEAVRQLVAGEIKALVLSGPRGIGKTHLMSVACNEMALPVRAALERAEYRFRLYMADQPWPDGDDWPDVPGACPLFVSVPDLLGAMKTEFRSQERPAHDALERLVQLRPPSDEAQPYRQRSGPPRLLGLDDVGAGTASSVSDWAAGQLHRVVDAAYVNDVSQFVSTNLSRAELLAAGYGRLVSRWYEGGRFVELPNAVDMRPLLPPGHRKPRYVAGPDADRGLYVPGKPWRPRDDEGGIPLCPACRHMRCPVVVDGVGDCTSCETCND